ncbi:hypothetical protein UFOVP779_41 [uncultured Caudovirales phage]|uniref:Uncharacterized protein n=1 Tax=uncultured Caudovirales phage TaxID=2100421 RepID=A0A6J5P4G9_9CAUD|nr:hypothetical protein UFOVP779_41 [uncultured Caudovirales phage]
MSYILTLVTGLILGCIGGLLIFRNNSAKLQGFEAKAKQTVDSLKK